MAIDYGKAFKLARTTRAMTQTEVAERAEITANYLSLIESSARIPHADTIERLAKALRVPVWAIVVLGSPDEEVPDAVQRAAMSLLTREEPSA
jgi:transcriptional regulator with XRE-family HTH domain